MSTKSSTFFKEYWDRQDSGQPSAHVSYEDVCRELRYYLKDGHRYSALELGCGNGDLFSHAQPFFRDYTGVDFSEGNLSVFGQRHPGQNLVRDDVLKYVHPRRCDLVYSVGLVQYLTYQQIEAMLRKNIETVSGDYRIVHMGFLDKRLQRFLFNGVLRPGVNRMQFKNVLKPAMYTVFDRAARLLRGGTHLGFWHTTDKIQDICDKLGCDYKITGSMTYRYRFNLVISGSKPSEANQHE